MNYTHRVKRAIAVGAAGAMMLTLAPVGVASANMHAPVCDGAGDSPFVDISGNTFENEIECLYHYRITTGTTPTTYSPGDPVQRGQMATFVVNAIEVAADAEMAQPAADQFPDISGNVHRENINKLAHADIVTGFPDGTYKATRTVSRGQMATFIAGAIEFHLDAAMARPASDVFPDISGNVHRDNINKLGHAGIVQGYGDGTFRASRDVSRGEMSKFIAWALGHWHKTGDFAPTAPGQPTVTVRPELTSAQILGTVTPTQATPANPAGTQVRYTFDEPIATFGANAPQVGNFHAYLANNARQVANAVVSAEGNTVVVRFNAIDSAALVEQLTLATTAFGAVRDLDQNLQNPESWAPIGTAATTPTGQAGVTAAPDLTNVSGFRPSATTGVTAVDFTFDANAFNQTPAGYSLVLVDNTLASCTFAAAGTNPSGGTVQGGNGTTTHTVWCNNPTGTPGSVAGTALTASNVARGVVDQGTVGTTAPAGTPPAVANPNPLQAFAVSPNPSTSGADLVSATFQLDAMDAATGLSPVDVIIYNFDSAVGTPGAAVNFKGYTSTGLEVDGAVRAVNPANDRQVRVEFANNSLTNAVGANVRDGAAANGQRDEVGVANPGQVSRTPGETSGPQLTAVELDQGTDVFGNPTGYRATYTFDEAIGIAGDNTATGLTVGRFRLWQADGTQLTASVCTRIGATATAGATQVRCTTYTGTPTGQTESEAIGLSVLGTVVFDAVVGSGGAGDENPEGARPTSGGTGTPAR